MRGSFPGGKFMDRYSKEAGFAADHGCIYSMWDYIDGIQQRGSSGFLIMCRNRVCICRNKYSHGRSSGNGRRVADYGIGNRDVPG